MIGIFSFISLRYAQFAYKYTDILDENDVEYELILWDRDSVGNEGHPNWITFDYPMNSFQPFWKKVNGFLSFMRYMRKMIREKHYDKLIILTTQTAIPLSDMLLNKYKGRYIYDYRDVTYEHISVYKRIVNKLVENSAFTAISSEGFKYNLNKSSKFVISHNSRDLIPTVISKNKSTKIRVTYWGMVRQLNFNYKICDLFANDDRFELVYHGAGFHEELRSYCQAKGYKNIQITGAYKLEEIESFARNTDILFNCYENDRQQKPAMTVKYYDALRFFLPMVATEGSYMGSLIKEAGIGTTLSLDDKNALNDLYNWYVSLNQEIVKHNMETCIDRIRLDDQVFKDALLSFCFGELYEVKK